MSSVAFSALITVKINLLNLTSLSGDQLTMTLIFLGPPGAGKSTPAKILAQQGPIDYISTGDVLTEAIAFPNPFRKRSRSLCSSRRTAAMAMMIRELLSQPHTKLEG